MRIFCAIPICLLMHSAAAQPNAVLYGPLSPDVATMQQWVNGVPSSVPVIALGGDEVLRLEFDILRAERDYLRYTLVHCNADWQPSDLSASEYAPGFNEWEIDDYAYSLSTSVPYTHYCITIADAADKPLVSGNYVLRVYAEGDPDDVIAQYRFMVTEQSARIDASVSTNTDIDFNKAHQQVSAMVDVRQSGVRDPFNNLTLKVSQNGRLDNEAVVTRPLKMLNATTVSYEHIPQLIFEAGNEYRRFETVSSNTPTMGVAGVDYHDPYYHYTLAADHPRAADMYLYDQTLRGGYVVRKLLADDSNCEADYGVVHFTLDCPYTDEYDIYIDGDMGSRRLDESTRMAYNRHAGMYERSLVLKQGAYSYQYVCAAKGAHSGTAAPIEGNFYQTGNCYRIVVYARNPIDRYDRIVAVAEIETMQK